MLVLVMMMRQMMGMPMMAGLRTMSQLGDGTMPMVVVVVVAIMARAMIVVAGEEEEEEEEECRGRFRRCRMSRGVRAILTITNPTLVVVSPMASAMVAETTVVVVLVAASTILATITLSKSEGMRIRPSTVHIVGVVHQQQPLHLHQADGANRLVMPEVVPLLDLTRQCTLPALGDMAMLLPSHHHMA